MFDPCLVVKHWFLPPVYELQMLSSFLEAFQCATVCSWYSKTYSAHVHISEMICGELYRRSQSVFIWDDMYRKLQSTSIWKGLSRLDFPVNSIALGRSVQEPMHLGRPCYTVSGWWQSAVLHGLAVSRTKCVVLWTWRKLAEELMQRTHPRSVEKLSQLEGYRQPSLSISRKVKTILMQRMNTSSS